ncbi:putative metal-dependent hydrolase related to alanyl-tRNA synthetase HxxxH domain protein [Aciduliprofundum sp. MAR08-339]|uniref:alanyl-tRNA editing protein n=1 Tax=Aciduliprofundum sp. (strain MAR08-339) TaxID=673860 RepID=UPI0002A4A010|nr:putative metal-dependent hydrolase related to alanyl-tRNA synthetase HxxxH domain protein [Aciduliprofundum sp. MAR08-339]
MNTELLYLEDSYLKEFDAKVIGANENGVYLDRTAFYLGGGGQPFDTGKLMVDGIEYEVKGMRREDALHIIDGEKPKVGERVHGIIDWERRYRIMRTHTAVHVVSGVAFRQFKVHITGNQLYEARARLDLSFENMSRELAEEIIKESNRVVERGLPVRWYYISKEEFMNRPELMRVNPELYKKYEKIRVVEIVGFDIQADGGTHVKNLKEIGKIELQKYESKGRKNKRIYITLK